MRSEKTTPAMRMLLDAEKDTIAELPTRMDVGEIDVNEMGASTVTAKPVPVTPFWSLMMTKYAPLDTSDVGTMTLEPLEPEDVMVHSDHHQKFVE